MIRQEFKIKHYWKVVVYYNVNYDLFDYIEDDLYNVMHSEKSIDRLYYNMSTHRAKAVTVSSIRKHKSVVLFNYHSSYYDYINSIVHEAEHIKQAMLDAYNVKDYGEPPAYTIGFLAMKMLMILKYLY